MPFVKGKSGNPAGRRKEDATVKDLARSHTAAAMAALVLGLKAKSETTRIAAAQAILDRGWGRPAQDSNVSLTGTLTLAELVAGSYRKLPSGD